MDELYDFLKESDSTMMKGISREEFKQTFGTSKGLDNLYSYLSNETPLVKGIDKETFISTFGSQQSRGIEDNYFDLGVLNNTWIGDWIDDMGRAIARGNRSGDATFDTLRIMSEGSDASNEDIKSYIEAAKNAQSIGQSDEFKAFTDAGGFSTGKGWMEFFKNALTITPEVVVESLSSMFGNTTTGSVLVGGAIATATGAGATLAPAALGLASGALETTSKFSQMLMEELNSRGLDFTEENIRSILEDEDALSEIRSKSLKKGLTIGAVDFLTGKVAGSFGAKLAKAATKTEKLVHVAKGIGIEATGGAGGEFAGELVSGEPLDATSIGLEAVGEIGPGAVNIFVGAYDAIRDKTKPSYKINGRTSDRATILERLKDPEFVKNNEIVVENDRELNDKILNYGKEPSTTPSTESGTTQSVPPTTATGDTGQITETPTTQGESQQQGPEQSNVQGNTQSTGENVQTTGQETNQGPIPDNTNLDSNPTPETSKVESTPVENTQQSQAETSQTTQESQATPVQETPEVKNQRVSKVYGINEENLNEFESIVSSEEYNNTDEQNNKFDKYRRDLSEEIAREKSNIANASTVEEENQAVSNLQKLRQKQKEFDSYQKYLNDKPQVQTLIEDETENSKKPNYEYQDLFDQDPRLAALQNAKDMLEWITSKESIDDLKKRGKTDEQIAEEIKRSEESYKKDIDILEKDLQINPTNQQTNESTTVPETVSTPATQQGGVQVLENPVIPIGEKQTPVVKVGDKYYRAKKDGTASKSEVKNKDFINEYETELRRRTNGRGTSGKTPTTGQTSRQSTTSQEGKTQQQKTTEEGGIGKKQGPVIDEITKRAQEVADKTSSIKKLAGNILKRFGIKTKFVSAKEALEIINKNNKNIFFSKSGTPLSPVIGKSSIMQAMDLLSKKIGLSISNTTDKNYTIYLDNLTQTLYVNERELVKSGNNIETIEKNILDAYGIKSISDLKSYLESVRPQSINLFNNNKNSIVFRPKDIFSFTIDDLKPFTSYIDPFAVDTSIDTEEKLDFRIKLLGYNDFHPNTIQLEWTDDLIKKHFDNFLDKALFLGISNIKASDEVISFFENKNIPAYFLKLGQNARFIKSLDNRLFEKLIPIYEKYYSEKDRNVSILSVPPVIDSTYINFEKVTDQSFEKYYNILKGFDKVDTVQDLENNNTIGALNPDGFVGKTLSVADGVNYVWSFFKYNELNIKNIDRLLNVNVRDSRFLNTSYKDMKGFDLSLLNLDNSNHKNDFYENVALTALRFAPLTSQEFLSIFDKLSEGHKKEFIIGRGKELKFNEEQILNVLKKYDLDNIHALGSLDLIFRLSDVHITRKVLDAIKEKITNTVIWSGIIENQSNVDPEIFTNDYYMDQLDWDNFDIAKSMKPEVLTEEFLKKYITRIHTMTLADIFNTRIKASNDFIFGLLENPLKNKFVIPYIVSDINIDLFNLLLKQFSKRSVNMILSESSMSDVVFDKVLETNILSIDDLASNPNLTDSQRYKLISKFNTKNTGPQTFYKLNEVLKDKNNLYVGHTYPLYTNKNVAEIVKYWIENWRKGISLTESASTFSNDFTISDIEVRSGQSRVVFNKNSTYTAYSPEDNYSVSYKKESRYGKSGGVKNLKYATRSTIHTNPNEISTLLDERDKNYKSGRDEWLITMNPAAIEKIEVYDREPTREELILNEEFGIPLEQHSINNNQTQLVKRWEGNSEKQFYYQRSNSGNTRGFYDFANKVAYLVDNVADESTTVHESFTHPFLEAAKIENPELYANLLKEAKKNSDVKAFVDDVYSDRPQAERDIEYITHAVDKYLRGELDAIKDKGLIERIKEFFKNMSDALKKILDIKTTVGEIDPNLTLGDLAQYVLYGEGQIDLTQTENQTETKSNTRKSQLGKRIQKGEGVSEQFAERVTDIDVLKQENDVTVAEADAVIEAFGEEAAQDFVLARDQKNGPSDSIRVTIGQRLVKRWADAADRAKTPEERDFFNSKAIEVLDGLMDLANDVGRALQMFRLWRDMGPEGYILYAKKLGEKIKKQAKKQFEKALNDIKKVNDKAVDEATRQIGEDIAKEYAIDKIKLIEVIRASLDKNLAAKMKEAFNLTAEESERLANRITKSFDNIYGRMIKETLKRSLPYKLRKYRNLIDNLVKNKKLTDDAIVSAILKELGINPDLTNEQMDYLREALRPMRDIPEDSAQLKDDGAREAIALIHEMFGSEAQSFIPKTNRDSLGWGLFYASILSGPRTQALNIGANIVKMVLDNTWLSIAEWRANKGNPERLRIAISNWLGLWQGIQKGRIEAKEIFFHGRKKTSFSNKFFESSELERWGKEWNIFNNIKNSKNFWEVALKQTAWMAKFVPRFMESADVIAYWGNYMGRYRQLMTEVKANQGYTGRALASEVNKIMYGGDITKQEAIDQATKELTDKDGKFKGKVGGGFYDKIDVRRRADEILEQNLVKQFGQEVLWDADRFAKNATFQQDPKGVMGTVVNTIQKYHSHKNKLVAVPARLIVPFTRIVANVTNDQLEYIPFIGLARGQNILSKNELTLEERRIATAKGLASMIVLGLGVAALSMFDPADEDEWKVKIHGNGPQDFNKIIQLKGENWQPNSLQVGNTYFSFKDMPFGLFLTLMGNLFDSERYSKGDPSMSASAIQSLLSSPQVILDASFLSGASAFFETVINSKDLKEDKMVENWEKFFVNQGKVVIPNLFRQVASSFDPTWYQTKGIKEYFYKQYAVPYIQLAGGEVDLQPYFTNLGDPVKFGRDGTFPTLARLSGISRFINVKKEDEIVYDFLDAKNIYIPGLGYGTTVDGKNLWSEDRETFVKLHRRRGELIKEYVKDNMERFKNMSKKDIEDEIKERVSGNTKESFTTEAKKELGLYSTKGRPKRPTRSTRKRGRD